MPRSTGEKYVLGSLDAKSATRLLNASSDVALVLDDEGTILEVLAQGDDPAARTARGWRGQSWVQTVTGESRQKVEAMLRDAQAAADAAGARWRQVNHPVDGDDELPLLYAAVRVDIRGTGDSEGVIRDEYDKGVLMMCDPRLISKPYGRKVWQSLPPMKRTRELQVVLDFFANR